MATIELTEWTPAATVTKLFDLVGRHQIRWDGSQTQGITKRGLCYRGTLDITQTGLMRLFGFEEIPVIGTRCHAWTLTPAFRAPMVMS